MVAEAGLDRIADLARRQRVGRVLESLDHLAAPEFPEVAAGLAAGAVEVLAREVGEIRTSIELLLELSDLRLRLVLGASRRGSSGALVREEDVRSTNGVSQDGFSLPAVREDFKGSPC